MGMCMCVALVVGGLPPILSFPIPFGISKSLATPMSLSFHHVCYGEGYLRLQCSNKAVDTDALKILSLTLKKVSLSV